MKIKPFYASAVSIGIAVAFALLGLTTITKSFIGTSLSTMTLYPAALFALLGLLPLYHGLRPPRRNR